MHRKIPQKVSLLGGMALLAAVVAGAIGATAGRESPRALERAAGASDALPSGARGIGVLKAGESRLAARFVAAPGLNRGVYVTRTEDGSMICVWDTDLFTGKKGGGCNDAGDFFGGRSFTMSLAYDGGPSVSRVGGARIVGVVTDEVASVEVVNSQGGSRAVAISPDRAFAYAVPSAELKAGVGPVAVVAFGADGEELDRQPTGIG